MSFGSQNRMATTQHRDLVFVVVATILVCPTCSWLPDSQVKVTVQYENIRSNVYYGNKLHSDYFKLLDQEDTYILLGARNAVYNISLEDLTENKDQRLIWNSTTAHQELCVVKGNLEDDCQNFVRVLAKTGNGKLLICGSNSYKPLCREYTYKDGKYTQSPDSDGVGLCPYNPEHNSTAVYYNGQLYTATVSSVGDALIYRKPLRTERSDLTHLNAPNFVSSFLYGDYVFFFFRETAVEFINCGKAVYSRVARVCKDDKGGPHQYGDRWTSFLKARLNCSIPGEYPFYFDEIQATSDVINGIYGDSKEEMIYTVMTTPVNAIGGSAICAYSMKSILKAFEGTFKEQISINSNWLPLPTEKIPDPHPSKCVKDSRTLPDASVNFIKNHPLMEDSVSTYFARPLLVRVSLKFRFTSIAVDSQVESIDGKLYDVLYIGTDDGRVLKAVNTNSDGGVQTVIITESQILPPDTPITALKVASSKKKLVVISRSQIRTVDLHHCANITSCRDCILLQDPHCAWNKDIQKCVALNTVSSKPQGKFLQNIENGDSSQCLSSGSAPESEKRQNKGTISSISENDVNDKIIEEVKPSVLSDKQINISNNSVQERLVIYSAGTLHIMLVATSFAALAIGFIAGYLCSRRFHMMNQFNNTPFIEQHNHLNSLSNTTPLNSPTQGSFSHPRLSKAINLQACNNPVNKVTKKDNNLETNKELNNSIESINKDTLQKVKKTYI